MLLKTVQFENFNFGIVIGDDTCFLLLLFGPCCEVRPSNYISASRAALQVPRPVNYRRLGTFRFIPSAGHRTAPQDPIVNFIVSKLNGTSVAF